MRSPTIEWQVAGACNYDCSYCIQSRRWRRGRPSAERIELALGFFARLSGTWEIKCSGGEAFAHPLFMAQIVPGLMERTPHRVSVLTNLSASDEELTRFVALTRGRLAVFSASLHLEHTTVEAFAARARRLVDQLDPGVRFVVNQVVLPGQEATAFACRAAIEAQGLRWFPQLFKTKGGVAPYPDEAALRAVIGDAPGPREANLAPSYRGRLCWAGVDYFTVDKDGEVWSCRTAKRHGQGRLGNLYDGSVTLLEAPAACPWEICPCTVPANRGMIEGVGGAEA
jgi:MoaA/NifB/PqqE/SkfB family radical SAM enzyme